MLIEMDVTQELPQNITIKDNEGNKMTQLVEYEWKPLFCDKCQKIGHKCAQIPPKQANKLWKPKPQSTQVKTVSTPTIPATGEAMNDWTKVASTNKMKGKSTLQPTPIPAVSCSNGFEPLGTLNGPLVAHDTGQ
jgi:hypothetical protein